MRVFDTSQLANRNFIGDALNTAGQTASIIDEFDQRKRRNLLQKRDDEEYRNRLNRRNVLEGREDTAYRQSQEDRNRNLARQEHQDDRAAEKHAAQMFREEEFQQSAGHRRKMEKLNLDARNAQLSAGETAQQAAKFELRQAKVAARAAEIQRDFMKVDALIDSNADASEINAVVENIAKNSGMKLNDVSAASISSNRVMDALAEGKKLDDPDLFDDLAAVYNARAAADGRAGNYAFDGFIKTGSGYAVRLKGKNGKPGFMTYAGGSKPSEIAMKFDESDIMEQAQGLAALTENINTIRKAYPLPQGKQSPSKGYGVRGKNEVIFNKDTGEQIAPPESSVDATADKNSEIIEKAYAEEGDTDGQIAFNLLKQAGRPSRALVEKAKDYALEEDIPVEEAVQDVIQFETNNELRPQFVDDLLKNNPELEAIQDDIPGIIDAEMSKMGGSFAEAEARIFKRYENYKRREENRATKADTNDDFEITHDIRPGLK